LNPQLEKSWGFFYWCGAVARLVSSPFLVESLSDTSEANWRSKRQAFLFLSVRRVRAKALGSLPLLRQFGQSPRVFKETLF
jgi:hypothetical protein